MPKMTPADWMVEIDNALEYRRIFAREDAWPSLENSYLHDPSGNTAIGPNLIFEMGDSLLSDLTVPDPEFLVTPTHEGGVDRAPIVEYVDNWLVKKLKIKRQVDMSLLNGYLKGRFILKLGYDSEFGYAPYYDIGREKPAGMTFTQFDKKGNRIETMNTLPGMPWVKAVPTEDFVVPWGTIFLDDAPWAANRIVRKNEYFKKDPKYKNTAKLEPQISMETYMGSYAKVQFKQRRWANESSHWANKDPQFNECWEIRDRMSGKVLVIARDYDKFLREDYDAITQVCGMPFVSGTFVTHPRSFWSTPLAYYLGQLQKTQFDISKQQEKERRINNLKFLMDENLITPTEANALINGDVGAIARIKGLGASRSLKDVMMAFPQSVRMDFFVQSRENRQNARGVIGYGRNQMGEEMQSSRRTKAEVDSVAQGSAKRSGRRAGGVIDLWTDMVEKVNKICFRFWKTPRYGLNGDKWVQFTAEEIEGDYLYDVSLTTKRAVSKAQRKVESLQLMMQIMMIGGDPSAAAKYIMDASGDPAFERILAPMMGKGGGGARPPQQAQPTGGQR